MDITLYLYNKSLISNGKKAHFILESANWEEAIKTIWNCRTEFNHRLIFLMNEPIVIGLYPEFIIENQSGKKIRDIRFWDLRLSNEHYLDTTYLGNAEELFNEDIEESDFLAMGFYNEALQSNLPTEQLRTLYLALEEIIGNSPLTAKCDKCGAILNAHAANEQIDNFFAQQENDRSIFGANNYPKASELRRLRAKLSHPPNKRGIINSRNLEESIQVLSRLIRCHLEKRFGLDYTSYAISKPIGTLMNFHEQYITQTPKEKFALDIPPIAKLINHQQESRWVDSN